MNGRQMKQLFRAYKEGDELAFRRAAQDLIEDEEAKQHLALARDLRRLLAVSPAAPLDDAVALPPPPVEREGEWPLADVRIPSRYFADLVLSGDNLAVLTELTAEVPKWPLLDQHGVPRRQRILFYGPAGTGKSSAAEALAAEVGLPLVVVRIDALVSSLLGETATNLRRVFEYVEHGSYVVLFDEFDALGRARDDPSEHGEIKRVVNALLQMIDGFQGASVLIAATNHEHMLDPAVWRRFDEALEFGRPTVHAIRKLLRLRLGPVQRSDVDIDMVAGRLKGLPQAAVEKAVLDARRRALLDGGEVVTGKALLAAADAVHRRPW